MQATNPTNDKSAESSTDKHGFVCLMKRYYPSIIWYILGVATPFLVLIVLVTLGIRPPKSKLENMVDKWHIENCNGDLLVVSVPVEPNIYFTLGMERDSKTGWLKEVGITKGENLIPGEAIFVYRAKGEYGTPMAYYGFPEQGIVWRDLNFDGRFDQRIDYKNKLMEINIGDAWVVGKGKADVKTDIGLFCFDPNAGEWKPVP
jgi:hypothetical protein